MAPKYRVGKKQRRAILEIETGREYLLFPVGQEEEAAEYCEWLNYFKEKNQEYISNLLTKYMLFALILGFLGGCELVYAIYNKQMFHF